MQGREGGREGIYLPSKQFHLTRNRRIRPNGSNALINKKIAFFGGLEFRAFNLSATCSTIRTVCLPPYLSHARVTSYSVSTKDIYDSYLLDVVHTVLTDFYRLVSLHINSQLKAPFHPSQLHFYDYFMVAWVL